MPVAANLYYSLSERGDARKPWLVLVHGAGGSHLSWPAELRRLAGWNVMAVDLPGHGRSAGLGQQSVQRYSNLLVDFLDEAGVHQAVLAGHSLGGAIVLQAALDQPTLAAALALVSTGAYMGTPPDLVQDFSDLLTLPQALGKFQRLAFSPETSPLLVEMSLKVLQGGRRAVLAGDWQACAAFDQRSQVERIACPAWVAVGADDRLTPLPYAHFLAARLANARLEVIPHAGHMVIIEKPAELTEGLNRFLEANFRGHE